MSFEDETIWSGQSPKIKGGFFWNKRHERTIDEIENFAFGRLKAFAYMEKFKHSKDFSTIKRLQLLTQEYGNSRPSFAKFIVTSKDKSVVDKVSFGNVLIDPQNVYQPKPIKTTYFSDLQSTAIRLEPPIDFSDFLMSQHKKEPPSDKSASEKFASELILTDPLLTEIIKSLPFFADIEAFKTASESMDTSAYNQRAYVYCVFASYYLQAFYRTSSLYNVELMTYFTMLFEKFEIQSTTTSDSKSKDRLTNQVKRYHTIKDRLKKGDIGLDMMITKDFSHGMDSSFDYLVDRDTGLPLESRLLHYGKGWPFKQSVKKPKDEDFAKLKVKTIAQMAELLLNEPILHDVDPSDKSKTQKQLYLFKTFEPMISGDLSDISLPAKEKSMLFAEDLRSKMLIALRELRKNILLHLYHEAVSPGRSQQSETIERLQKEFTSREVNNNKEIKRSKIEFTLDEIFDKVLKPVSEKMNRTVSDNFSAAQKKLSKTISITKVSDASLDSDLLLSGTHYSISKAPAPIKPNQASLVLPSPMYNLNSNIPHKVNF